MRCFFGFVLALAVGAMGCSETSGTGGSGGSEGSGREIGDRFPAIDTLALTLNRLYDNGDQRGDERYTFEVADLTVTHTWVRSNDPPDLLPPATRDAMDALVAVVQSTSYRFNENCEDLAIDGVPFSPRVTVRHGADELRLGVSDSECAGTDHSYHGPVMRCAAFEVVFGAVREIVPSVESETCAWYW